MRGPQNKLNVLLDEGVPVLVADPILAHGHDVIYHNDVLASGTKDEIVVATALLNSAILIAMDADMKRMARRFGAPNLNEKFKRLNLIYISCNEVLAAKRIDHAMTFIEN